MVTGDEEIAEEVRIGARGRRHVDEKAVERLRLLGRREEVDVIAFDVGIELARPARFEVGRGGGVGRADVGAEVEVGITGVVTETGVPQPGKVVIGSGPFPPASSTVSS